MDFATALAARAATAEPSQRARLSKHLAGHPQTSDEVITGIRDGSIVPTQAAVVKAARVSFGKSQPGPGDVHPAAPSTSSPTVAQANVSLRDYVASKRIGDENEAVTMNRLDKAKDPVFAAHYQATRDARSRAGLVHREAPASAPRMGVGEAATADPLADAMQAHVEANRKPGERLGDTHTRLMASADPVYTGLYSAMRSRSLSKSRDIRA